MSIFDHIQEEMDSANKGETPEVKKGTVLPAGTDGIFQMTIHKGEPRIVINGNIKELCEGLISLANSNDSVKIMLMYTATRIKP
jgi:hypothetical protein